MPNVKEMDKILVSEAFWPIRFEWTSLAFRWKVCVESRGGKTRWNAPSDLRLSSDNNLAFLVKKNKQRTGYLWSNIIDSVFQPEPWTTLFFPPYYKISFNKRSHYTYSTCGDVWRLRATFSILNSIGVWYFSPSRISSCLSECKHWSGSVGPDTRDLDICCPQRLHHRHKVANGFWDWKEI